jgi:hypothetical protein
MLTSVLILTISAVLLVYWFRYTCLLLLRAQNQPARIARVAEANGLSFLAVQGRLDTMSAHSSAELERQLDRDYRILAFLLEHAARGASPMEQIVLRIDFRLMQVCCRIVRIVSPANAKGPLAEMAAILTRMSGMIGDPAEG